MKTEEIKKTQEMKALKDIFVPYEIAQKLKEIGFDEPCIAVYNPMKKIEIGFYELLIRTNFVSEEELIIQNFNELNDEHYCSAPTYDQVIKWFFKRRIYGHINPFLTSLGIQIGAKSKDYYRATFGFASYEQAREKLILNLIEVYKKP